jgi:excisionase family DNA binding protein
MGGMNGARCAVPMEATTLSDNPTQPLTVTVEEFARDGRFAESTVYSAISRGEIQVVRVGRAIRIPRRERDRLLQGVA